MTVAVKMLYDSFALEQIAGSCITSNIPSFESFPPAPLTPTWNPTPNPQPRSSMQPNSSRLESASSPCYQHRLAFRTATKFYWIVSSSPKPEH